jgi:dihydroflavonol-4-reductase
MNTANARTTSATGRIGERYISERFISARELNGTAAEAGGTRPPRVGIPLKIMYALGFGGEVAATLLRCDMLLSTLSVRLMHIMSPVDHEGRT